MEAKLHSCECRLCSESSKERMDGDTGRLLRMTRSAPTRAFAWSSISSRRLYPKDKVATSAAIPRTMEDMNRNRRLRLRRLSRQAMRKSQETGNCLSFFICNHMPPFYPDNTLRSIRQFCVMGYEYQGRTRFPVAIEEQFH